MRQTAFCSQACNTGRFGQDLLKPVFITCLTSFSSALRLHGFLYLFFCIYQPWVLHVHSLRRSHSLPVKWVATSARYISYRGKPSWATALCASKGGNRTWWGVQLFRGGFRENIPLGATFLTVLRVLPCQREWIKPLCLLLPLHISLWL